MSEVIGLEAGCAVSESVFAEMLLNALWNHLTVGVEACEPYDDQERGLVTKKVVVRFQGKEVASCPTK